MAPTTKQPPINRRTRIIRGLYCEIRCEQCLGKPRRCPRCEGEVQAFLAAVKGKQGDA